MGAVPDSSIHSRRNFRRWSLLVLAACLVVGAVAGGVAILAWSPETVFGRGFGLLWLWLLGVVVLAIAAGVFVGVCVIGLFVTERDRGGTSCPPTS